MREFDVFYQKYANFATMLIKTVAIVLHSFKYNDNKIIIDLFTCSNGRMSVVAPLSNSPKAKIKKQLFQPLTIIETSIDVRHNASIHKITDARIAQPFTSIPFNPYKLSISIFIADFLNQALMREQADKPLFAYIQNSIEWLDNCNEGFANFHLVFMMRLSMFLGFYPNTDNYHSGSCFDLRSACFSGVVPMHNDYLKPAEASIVGLILRMNFANMHLFRLSRSERNRLIDIILHYYRLHLPSFGEMKSLEILRELF